MKILFLVALLLFIVLVLLLGSKVFGQRRTRSASILIVGPCGSGKTLLFYRLVHDETVDTVSSMQPNESPASPDGLPLRLVDLPGHYRLRGLLPDELECAQAIIFVFDASDALKQAKPAAELLYAILSTFADSKTGPDLLFICNKSDNKVVKTTQRVKLMMMNEIETLRKTENSIQSTADGASSSSEQAKLGIPGQFFNFDAHSPCKIDFILFSARKDDLTSVRQFIQAHASS